MTGRTGLVALLALVGFVSLAGASATGAPTGDASTKAGWQPATTLYAANPLDSARVFDPKVVVDGEGDATAVWLYGPPYGQGPLSLMEADWTSTAGWTPARTLSAFGTDVYPQSPALAVDARGDAVIAWNVDEAGANQLRVSYRTAGGDWQQPRTLRPGGDVGVGIDDRGRALVIWNQVVQGSPHHPSQFSLRAVSRSRSGGWRKPTTSTICDCVPWGSRLALNPRGLAIVVWMTHHAVLWERTRSPAGRWSRPQRIALNAFAPNLVLNSRGDAVVSFEVGSAQYPAGQLTVAIRPANGRFGHPQTIGGDAYWGEQLALAPTGEAVIMWHNGGCCLYAMSRLPGAPSFTSQQTLDPAPGYGDAMPEALAIDAHGNALALWLRSEPRPYSYGQLYLHAAQRPTDGSFDSGSDIGAIGEDSYKHSACNGSATLATTPDGHAIAVWLQRTTIDNCATIEAATFTP